MEEIELLVEKIVRDLAAIENSHSRTVIISERLSTHPAYTAVEILRVIFDSSSCMKPGYQEVMLSLLDIRVVEKWTGAGKVREIADAAFERGYEDIYRHFTGVAGMEHPVGEDEVEKDPEIQALTLGERKSLARAPNKKRLLDKLLHDQDPTVIANLINNPRLTERDILKIASKRPTRSWKRFSKTGNGWFATRSRRPWSAILTPLRT
jgi:hypothetical protein